LSVEIKMLRFTLLILYLTLLHYSSGMKVLWIGNSFTYYNDLPSLVADMAAADGNQYEYDSHLEGGWTWEKHAQSEETLNKISSQKWDVVVLQEYSTRLAYNQEDVCRQTIPYLDILVDHILTNNPETMVQFYLSWGRPYGEDSLCGEQEQFCQYETMQDALTDGYTKVACMKKPSRVAPVGEGFRNVKLTNGDALFRELYFIDEKHPSLAGSYLSALTHYMALYNLTKINMETIPKFGLDDGIVKALVAAAEKTRNQDDWEYGVDRDCVSYNCQE